MTKTTKQGRPPKMTGGAPHTIYLPAHVWEWLIKQGASQTITKLVEKEKTKMIQYECPQCKSHKCPGSGWDSHYPPEDNPTDEQKWWFCQCHNCGYMLKAKNQEDLDAKLFELKWET